MYMYVHNTFDLFPNFLLSNYASVGGAPEAYSSQYVCVYHSEELWQNSKELDDENCTIAE